MILALGCALLRSGVPEMSAAENAAMAENDEEVKEEEEEAKWKCLINIGRIIGINPRLGEPRLAHMLSCVICVPLFLIVCSMSVSLVAHIC